MLSLSSVFVLTQAILVSFRKKAISVIIVLLISIVIAYGLVNLFSDSPPFVIIVKRIIFVSLFFIFGQLVFLYFMISERKEMLIHCFEID